MERAQNSSVKRIAYKAGYRYQLAASYNCQTNIHPETELSDNYARLDESGGLWISENYAWDGPSGPTIDTSNFMRGSLVHDVLYQMIREGLLPHSYREAADQELRRICLEDGMSAIRAWWVYQAVKFGGGPSADPLNDRPVLVAPCASDRN